MRLRNRSPKNKTKSGHHFLTFILLQNLWDSKEGLVTTSVKFKENIIKKKNAEITIKMYLVIYFF